MIDMSLVRILIFHVIQKLDYDILIIIEYHVLVMMCK